MIGGRPRDSRSLAGTSGSRRLARGTAGKNKCRSKLMEAEAPLLCARQNRLMEGTTVARGGPSFWRASAKIN